MTDTDAFVLLVFFYWKLKLKSKVTKELTTDNRSVINIGDTVTNNLDIVSYLLAAQALSGCDTATPYHRIGKLTVAKRIERRSFS